MYYETHPEVLRQVVANRQEELQRAAHLARLQRAVRVRRPRRRLADVLRAGRPEHRPELVAPPPALAD